MTAPRHIEAWKQEEDTRFDDERRFESHVKAIRKKACETK